jgi:Protein of unknown function (DUF3810)
LKRGSKIVKWGAKWVWQIVALLLVACTFFPELVQLAYTKLVFKWGAMGLRIITGSIPFAIGEYLYLLLIILLIYKLLLSLYKLKYQLKIPILTANTWYIVSKKASVIFVIFELIWGLNYQQITPAKDFNLQVPKTYTERQMDSMSLSLISQLNNTRSIISDSQLKSVKGDSLIKQTLHHYGAISEQYSFLSYSYPNVKWAQLPRLGDYIGYLAFYHPITGEAIVRDDLPILTLPFTISHEIAHQLGYASETEANFIAYVVALNSKDPLFEYAMQLQLFTYSQEAQLFMIAKSGNFKKWEAVVKRNKALLSPKVLSDRKLIWDFFRSRQNQRLPGSEKLYDQFLIWNKQANGINSYNDVLLWALAYQKKSA